MSDQTAEQHARQRLRPVFLAVMATKFAVALFLVARLLVVPHGSLAETGTERPLQSGVLLPLN